MFKKILTINDIPKKLFDIGSEVRFKKGDIILTQGDPTEDAYIIVSGKLISYSIGKHGLFSYNSLIASPCIIGESQAINRNDMHASFKCIENVLALKISRDSLLEIIKSDFDMIIYLYNVISKKFIITTNQVFNYATLSSGDRVIYLLIEFAEFFGEKIGGKIKIDFKFSQQFISDLAGVKRLTAIRTINKLKREGIIEFKNGSYYINDIDCLKKLTQIQTNK